MPSFIILPCKLLIMLRTPCNPVCSASSSKPRAWSDGQGSWSSLGYRQNTDEASKHGDLCSRADCGKHWICEQRQWLLLHKEHSPGWLMCSIAHQRARCSRLQDLVISASFSTLVWSYVLLRSRGKAKSSAWKVYNKARDELCNRGKFSVNKCIVQPINWNLEPL